MRVVLCNNTDEIAGVVSSIIIGQVNSKPNSILGFATGSSPEKTYERLVSACANGEVSFSDVMTYNLDEYVGVSKKDECGYFRFMNDKLFSLADFDSNKVNFLDGLSKKPDEACERFSSMIAETGIDIQLLGIGRNGHIGFNEPADSFTRTTHKVELSKSTIEANSRFFEKEEDVPTSALTMGIGDIMKAKKILLIAPGPEKAEAVMKTVTGKISPYCPASVLQLHQDTTIFVTPDSASMLDKKYISNLK